jgi:anthraniloyl-CoA monooxygenase
VIASDGLNSRVRERYQATYQPDVDTRRCRFVWLGTRKLFSAFTFAFEQTEHGWFQAHAYQYDGDTSTFIVETPEDVWQRAGLQDMSQEQAIAFCEKLFARYLDGHALMSNAAHLRGSASWIKFPRVLCRSWVHWNTLDGREVPVVLMGDAAHTAHFSIGSGTKLALEDAIELSECFSGAAGDDLHKVLEVYQEKRSVEVLKIQSAARNSMEWFENVERYTHLQDRAVCLCAAHAQPAHLAREPAPARQGVPRTLRAMGRRACIRAGRSCDAGAVAHHSTDADAF